MYYLQSRYYAPEIGRFINADAFVSTGQGFSGNNMFAYCGNEPAMHSDPIGTSLRKAAIVAGAVATIAFFLVENMPSKNEHYRRNEFNEIPDDELKSIVEGKNENWIEVDDKYNAYHRFTNGTQGDEAIYNKKYMSKDGTKEVIICYDPEMVPIPYRVTDPNNEGTYNYGSDNVIDHFVKDVLPYWIYKNSEDDTTKWYQRVFGN